MNIDNNFFLSLLSSYWKLLVIIAILIIIVKYIYPFLVNKYRHFKYMKLLRLSNIYQIDKLNGFEFEEYLKERFNKLGYKSLTTSKTKDYGADLVLSGKNVIKPVIKLDVSLQMKKPFLKIKKYYTSSDNKIVVQAKRYNSKVGMRAIQEVYTAKKFYKADEAWVITNNYYTDSAKSLAHACNVKILDRNDLMEFIIHKRKTDY